MYEAFLSSVDENIKFQTILAPFPEYETARENKSEGQVVLFSLIFGMALSIIPTSVISYVILERESNVKHMQLTAGVSIFAYWLANFIVDFILTAITISLMILVSIPFEMMKESDILRQFLALYVPVIVAFTYMMSLCF